MLLVITAQNQFFVVDFTMDAIVDPNSGLASEAALRDTYVAQLEAFMAETRVLTAERVSLGDTKTDRQRKAAIILSNSPISRGTRTQSNYASPSRRSAPTSGTDCSNSPRP